jgi:3-oxoacyl-[acyl-carrier protein] reductase
VDRAVSRPENATALVTGASKGIGAAIAKALAADGWAVAVNYRGDEEGANATVEAIVQEGGKAKAFQADVSNGDSKAFLKQVETEMDGPVLALVNNAGVARDNIALQLTDEDWDVVIGTNLTPAFKLTRDALRSMIKARYGRVVNIASVVGPRANAGQSNYAAAKAGLIGLTKTIATEVARRGVTVNAVAPGFIATDMTDRQGDPGAPSGHAGGGRGRGALPRLRRGRLRDRHHPLRRRRHVRLTPEKENTPMATAITEENVQKTVYEALPQFGVDESQITREATFEDLDVDSLDLAELSQIIEDEYGVALKGDDVGKIKTVGDAIDLVVQRGS